MGPDRIPEAVGTYGQQLRPLLDTQPRLQPVIPLLAALPLAMSQVSAVAEAVGMLPRAAAAEEAEVVMLLQAAVAAVVAAAQADTTRARTGCRHGLFRATGLVRRLFPHKGASWLQG